ncbi:MAG: SDR family NAD(P)-dependent oxidoreductase [Acidimicrobiia bacterium]
MPEDRWSPPDLSGQVAVVTGASRGAGRGIAEVLAECGMKTYLVARSINTPPRGRTGTLEEVAEGIEARGGEAVIAQCDLSDDESIDALFERVTKDEGHLEILVNNAVGWGNHGQEHDVGVAPWMMQPPWKAPRWWWDDNFAVGVRSHWVMTNAAAPLLIKGRRGVVFFTSEIQPDEAGMAEFVLDIRATAVQRMAFLFSLHLRPHRVSSIFLYPGFIRSDAIERAFRERADYFNGWTEEQFRKKTASIHYAGRAAAMLAADPELLDKSGSVVQPRDAAEHYGFTDTDGTQLDPL